MSDSKWNDTDLTVKDLIEILSKFPEDTHVVLSGDAEGNDYSPLVSWSPAYYIHESTWSGEVLLEESELDDYEIEYEDAPDRSEDQDIPISLANAIVLWPVN